MTKLTFEAGAFAGLIIGSAIGASAMYFATKKKMRKRAEELERNYRECIDEVVEQLKKDKEEAVQQAREIILNSHYATPEEVMMEMEADPREDPFFSIEDSYRIELKEFEGDLPDEEYERYTWYYDAVDGELREETDEPVEFHYGMMFDNMLKDLEKEGVILGPGDSFFIRNDTHEFFAEIVLRRVG